MSNLKKDGIRRRCLLGDGHHWLGSIEWGSENQPGRAGTDR